MPHCHPRPPRCAALLRRRLALAGTFLLGALLAEPLLAAGSKNAPLKDPLDSARWEEMRRDFLPNANIVFDPLVKVEAPESSETPLTIPVAVDASALKDVEQIIVFADFNPIPLALRFNPDKAQPYLGFRIKLQQSTPIRAAARTRDGVWHVNGTWVATTGGGCTVPSVGAGSPEWQRRLNEVSGRLWRDPNQGNAGRLRVRVIHPMDTGLIAGTPAFYLTELEVSGSNGEHLMRIEPAEPVSENPVFTLRLRDPLPEAVEVKGRDNNGNRLQARITE